MPTARFKTTSSAPSVPSRESAEFVVAEVVKYLAYADQTDNFGYHGAIETVEVAPSRDSVAIEWRAPVTNEEEIRTINDSMEIISHVRHHECLSNPNL